MGRWLHQWWRAILIAVLMTVLVILLGTSLRYRGIGEASGIALGTCVVAGAGQWCGQCGPCLAGRTNLCHSYFTYGLQANGVVADYVTVPAQMCVPVPDACDDGNAVLAQPMAIAMHALSRGGAAAGDPVGVVGAGALAAC